MKKLITPLLIAFFLTAVCCKGAGLIYSSGVGFKTKVTEESSLPAAKNNIVDFGAGTEKTADENQTAIQSAVNALPAEGGTVYVPSGTFLTKPFKLRSNMTLYLDEGAVIKGTDNWRDYASGDPNNGKEGWLWSDCLIRIPDNSQNITIDGTGTIDGSNCQNFDYGENKNRGPHIFHIIGCTNLTVKNITMKNSGNYNFRFDNCQNVLFENLTLLRGQDGFHSQSSENVRVINCVIHTPDDNVAGSGNKDWFFENCKFMSNGSAFDFGCLNLTVQNCHFGGDFDMANCSKDIANHSKGEKFPKEMQTAFRFFSPRGRNPKNDAGNWVIKDCTVDQVGIFFALNRPLLIWQVTQDLKSVSFENIHVTNLCPDSPLIGGDYGDKSVNFVDFPQQPQDRQIQVYMNNCSFEYKPDATGTILVASDFDRIEIHNSSFTGGVAGRTFIDAKNGNTLILDNVTGNGGAINTSNIDRVVK